MGKYNSLAELFTATADAIRTKTEGTEPIVAEDFPEAIADISTGGGSILPFGGGVSKFATGTFTVASIPTFNVTVEHDLGYTPSGGMIYMITNPGATTLTYSSVVLAIQESSGFNIIVRKAPGTTSTRADTVPSLGAGDITGAGDEWGGYLIYGATDTSITFGTPGENTLGVAYSTAFLTQTYAWIVW